VARSWDDDGLRQRLLDEPEAVLREEGIDVPEGMAVRIVAGDVTAGGEGVAYLRLPGKPRAEDLVEDDLSLPPDGPNDPMNTIVRSSCRHSHSSWEESRPGSGPMNIITRCHSCARSRPS
jgi:hypothetical protein